LEVAVDDSLLSKLVEDALADPRPSIPAREVFRRLREFHAEAHRQSLAVARSPHAKDDQDFVDAVSDWDPE